MVAESTSVWLEPCYRDSALPRQDAWTCLNDGEGPNSGLLLGLRGASTFAGQSSGFARVLAF